MIIVLFFRNLAHQLFDIFVALELLLQTLLLQSVYHGIFATNGCVGSAVDPLHKDVMVAKIRALIINQCWNIESLGRQDERLHFNFGCDITVHYYFALE